MTRSLRFGIVVLLGSMLGCHQAERGSEAAPARTTPLQAARADASAPAQTPGVVVPVGTVLPIRLDTGLSSATSHAGDLVVGRLAQDVMVGGAVALPSGTEVRGKVTAATPSGRVKGRAHLAFDFDSVVLAGTPRSLEAWAVAITAPSGKKKDAAIIGGGAAGGALVGALLGGGKGAGIGALAGGAAGTGVVLTTKGKEVAVPAGSRVRVKLSRELRLG